MENIEYIDKSKISFICVEDCESRNIPSYYITYIIDGIKFEECYSDRLCRDNRLKNIQEFISG